MNTTIKSARITQSIDLSTIPNGEYKGTWGGYIATAIIHGEVFEFQTEDGIKTINAKCIVRVQDDFVTVELVKD